MGVCNRQPLAEDKGVHREVESEGGLRQSSAPTLSVGFEIPKEGGKKRMPGIPTVLDRVIRQAISKELTKLYEPQFSAYSYGFRPKRNAHQH